LVDDGERWTGIEPRILFGVKEGLFRAGQADEGNAQAPGDTDRRLNHGNE